MTEPVSSSSASYSSSSGMTIDIRPMIEDVSQVMTKHITNILTGVIGEYTVYKETHDTIMGLPCVRKLQQRITELESFNNDSSASKNTTNGSVPSASREDEIAQLQSAIAELNRYIVALESKVDMKTVYSSTTSSNEQQHEGITVVKPDEEESVRLEVHEEEHDDMNDSKNNQPNVDTEAENVATFIQPSNSKNVIISSTAEEEEKHDEEDDEEEADEPADDDAKTECTEGLAQGEKETEDEDAEDVAEVADDADAVDEEEDAEDTEAADEEEKEAADDAENADKEEVADEEEEADDDAEEEVADEEEEADDDAEEEADDDAEEEDDEDAEEEEATEDAEAVEEEAEIEVSEVKIKGKTYFTTDPQNGIIYACVDDDVGDEVGVFKNGVAVFNKGKK
jgi:hypothetical protein